MSAPPREVCLVPLPDAPLDVDSLRATQRTGLGWAHVFEALGAVVDNLARRYGSGISRDEIEQSLHILTYERYLTDYLHHIEAGQASTFQRYVAARHRDHLRARLRTTARRRALEREKMGAVTARLSAPVSGEDPGALRSPFPQPDADLHVKALLTTARTRALLDDIDEHILVALEHGHAQREIAALLALSEPSVSRRVARIRDTLSKLLDDDCCRLAS